MGTTIAQFSPDPMREIELMTAAVELFKARYPNDPGHFNSVFALGQLYRTQGEMHKAVEYFRAASEVFQHSGLQAYSDLGASYAWAAFCEMQLGWVDDALRDYEKGIELLRQHVGDVSVYTRIHLGLYGQVLHQAGKTRTGARLFRSGADAGEHRESDGRRVRYRRLQGARTAAGRSAGRRWRCSTLQ